MVRIAGPEARRIAGPILRLKHEMEPGRAVFGEFVEPSSEVKTPTLSQKDATRVGHPTAELCSAGQPGAAVPTQDSRIDDFFVN